MHENEGRNTAWPVDGEETYPGRILCQRCIAYSKYNVLGGFNEEVPPHPAPGFRQDAQEVERPG